MTGWLPAIAGSGRRTRPTRRPPSAPERQRGQSMVEFALVFPIFILCLFGLIDGSRLVYMNSTLSQAAREGAREASVEASWLASTDGSCNTTGGPTCPATLAALQSDVVSAVNRMTTFGAIPGTNVYLSCDATTPPTGNWTTQTCTSNSSGDYVSVRVTQTFNAITPLIGQIFGPISLSGSATMTIN